MFNANPVPIKITTSYPANYDRLIIYTLNTYRTCYANRPTLSEPPAREGGPVTANEGKCCRLRRKCTYRGWPEKQRLKARSRHSRPSGVFSARAEEPLKRILLFSGSSALAE